MWGQHVFPLLLPMWDWALTDRLKQQTHRSLVTVFHSLSHQLNTCTHGKSHSSKKYRACKTHHSSNNHNKIDYSGLHAEELSLNDIKTCKWLRSIYDISSIHQIPGTENNHYWGVYKSNINFTTRMKPKFVVSKNIKKLSRDVSRNLWSILWHIISILRLGCLSPIRWLE